jgi:septum formation protein
MVEELALRKAAAVAKGHPDDTVIGADTVVVLDGEILGKPRDEAEARAMLAKLAGRWHTVYTGVAVLRNGEKTVFSQSAKVEFAPMSAAQIAAYVATGEPMDKAGAYGIQGKGALFVRGIEGDFYTVMGLPVCGLYNVIAGIL